MHSLFSPFLSFIFEYPKYSLITALIILISLVYTVIWIIKQVRK